MTNEEAYNHGYNGTLTLDELMALFPPCGLRDEEPSQFSAWRSGAQDAEYDAESDSRECAMEADAEALASAGWGMDEDYGFACDMM